VSKLNHFVLVKQSLDNEGLDLFAEFCQFEKNRFVRQQTRDSAATSRIRRTHEPLILVPTQQQPFKVARPLIASNAPYNPVDNLVEQPSVPDTWLPSLFGQFNPMSQSAG
jgi:hypothetical protein